MLPYTEGHTRFVQRRLLPLMACNRWETSEDRFRPQAVDGRSSALDTTPLTSTRTM